MGEEQPRHQDGDTSVGATGEISPIFGLRVFLLKGDLYRLCVYIYICVHIISIRCNPLYRGKMCIIVLYITFLYV